MHNFAKEYNDLFNVKFLWASMRFVHYRIKVRSDPKRGRARPIRPNTWQKRANLARIRWPRNAGETRSWRRLGPPISINFWLTLMAGDPKIITVSTQLHTHEPSIIKTVIATTCVVPHDYSFFLHPIVMIIIIIRAGSRGQPVVTSQIYE